MKPVNVLIASCVCVLAAAKATLGCFPADNADYDEWLSVGQPLSWCYPRQCHGDADGLNSPPPPSFPVYTNDLSILLNDWKKPLSMDPCLGADIDHRAACSPFAGCWRIGPRDLCILQQFFGLAAAFVPANCQNPGAVPPGTVGPILSLQVDTGSGFYAPVDPIIVDINSTVKIGIVNNTTDLGNWYDAHVVIYGSSDSAWTGNNWVYSTTVTGWTYYGRDVIPEMDAWFVEVSGGPVSGTDYGPLAGSVSAWVEFSPVAAECTHIYLFDDQCSEPILDSIQICGRPLHLLYPNGGETIYAGQSCQITWTGNPEINDVRIEYSADNGGSWTEVNPPNTGNTGSYGWLVPAIESSQCLVKASDDNNTATYDTSDSTFTIVIPATITVISPNGGETLSQGQNCQITWTNSPDIDDVKIEYSADNGGSWTEVSPPNTSNTGSYNWLVPTIVSTQCLVRTSDASNPATYDTSDSTFTIAIPPTITVISPNGGESIMAGGEYLIEWSCSGDIDDVFIEYSDNDGSSWNPIVQSTINDGEYKWDPVANSNSNQCLLRISDVANPSTNDASNGLFTIFQCTHSIVGDLNEDCYIDFFDVAILLNHWLECGNQFDDNCS